MILQYGNNLLTGLQNYWKFNGDSVDAIGGNNGTDTDITYVSGKINQAASFNGTSSKITIAPFTIVYGNEYTFSFWIKTHFVPGLPNSGLGGVFCSTVNNYGFVNYSSYPPQQLGFAANLNTAGCATPNLGQWNHIVMTITGAGALQYYVNGKESGTPGSINANITLDIFGYYGAYHAYLDIPICEFGIWNRVLTHSDINDLYNLSNGLDLQFFKTNVSKILVHGNNVLNNRPPLIKGIKAAFNFDNNLVDSTGNGYDILGGFGPIYDVTFASGVVNQSGVFAGAVYAPFIVPLDMSNVGTISFWINPSPSAPATTNSPVIGSNSGAAAVIYRNTAVPNTLVLNSGSNQVLINNIFQNIWTHVVISYDANGANTYVNGHFQSFTAGAIGTLTFGYVGYSGSSGERFNGQLDAINFFDRPLRSEDVHQLYTTQKQYPF